MVILLMAINSYFIDGFNSYSKLNYHKLLMAINGYFINGY
jgi:hypothetical protein